MFICKICDEEYDENMRYSRDSRYCKNVEKNVLNISLTDGTP